jgi:peptidoglycan/xylan/chitin deacetylase (PgdA/CDA1 family)
MAICVRIVERILTRGEGLQNQNEKITAQDSLDNKGNDYRRRRVNRMKTAIVVIVILFLILPTICCIILGIQVRQLQLQMEKIVELHSEYGLTYDGENYAYAAEKIPEEKEKIVHLEIDEMLVTETELDTQSTVDNTNNSDSNTLLNNKEIKLETAMEGIETTIQGDPISFNGNTSSDTATMVQEKDQGNNQIVYTGLDAGIYSEKEVYLTFDDGPSIYTDDILDILAKYNVKATFFVVGKTDKGSKEIYKRIVEEGHTLGMHSYSHKYEKIYNSVEDFDKDFTKLWKLLYDTTGYKPSIFRFPGGSDNLVNKNGMEDFIQFLNKEGIVYFDWNVLNGDATGVDYTKEQLIDNVLDGVAYKKRSIVLMHDAQNKKTTVDSLPELLELLITEGAQMLPLDEVVTPIQMIKADSIK